MKKPAANQYKHKLRTRVTSTSVGEKSDDRKVTKKTKLKHNGQPVLSENSLTGVATNGSISRTSHEVISLPSEKRVILDPFSKASPPRLDDPAPSILSSPYRDDPDWLLYKSPERDVPESPSKNKRRRPRKKNLVRTLFSSSPVTTSQSKKRKVSPEKQEKKKAKIILPSTRLKRTENTSDRVTRSAVPIETVPDEPNFSDKSVDECVAAEPINGSMAADESFDGSAVADEPLDISVPADQSLDDSLVVETHFSPESSPSPTTTKNNNVGPRPDTSLLFSSLLATYGKGTSDYTRERSPSTTAGPSGIGKCTYTFPSGTCNNPNHHHDAQNTSLVSEYYNSDSD